MGPVSTLPRGARSDRLQNQGLVFCLASILCMLLPVIGWVMMTVAMMLCSLLFCALFYAVLSSILCSLLRCALFYSVLSSMLCSLLCYALFYAVLSSMLCDSNGFSQPDAVSMSVFLSLFADRQLPDPCTVRFTIAAIHWIHTAS